MFFKRLISLIISFFYSFGCSIGLLYNTEPKNAEDFADYGYVSQRYECSRDIVAVDIGSLDADELDTAICLQGIVAKDKPSIVIVNNYAARKYLSEYEKLGYNVLYNDPDGRLWTLRTLLLKFKDHLNGYTLYKQDKKAFGLNAACNYATAYGYLAVPESLQDLCEECGIEKKADLSKEKYNYRFELKHFNKLKKYFTKGAVVHENSDMHGLRDWAIQQKFFICNSEFNFSGREFLKKILRFTGRNTAVFGWTEAEDDFVEFLSDHSAYITPSDHSYNNSFFSNVLFENTEQIHNFEHRSADPDKHYAALVFSDGDNSQWVQNGFSEYYAKLKLENDFPITWTFPLIQQEVCPVSRKLVYESATQNNYFIGGVSGIGYMNPSHYNKKDMDEYLKRTSGALLRSNIDIISVLDRSPDKHNYFDAYASYSNIKGGIVQNNPDYYAGSKGKVWFSGDKPFVSVRFSLWHPSCEMSEVTDQWLEEQAAAVNSFKADIHSINGYSVINIHPWSISIKSLDYFVSLLDEHIELVTADNLIDMIAENCQHKDALPD